MAIKKRAFDLKGIINYEFYMKTNHNSEFFSVLFFSSFYLGGFSDFFLIFKNQLKLNFAN